jgi:hypothetical protein
VWAVAFWVMKQAEFLLKIPEKPYCAVDPRKRLFIRPREKAIALPHIQPNHRFSRNWLTFDIDEDFAYFAPEDRNCPEPHFIAINAENGHAHIGYLLDTAVALHDKSRREPIMLYRDVERGLGRRLGADPSYHGATCKNPFSDRWKTSWHAVRPYDLAKLVDCLDRSDKKRSRMVLGVGRNCSLFDSLRIDAYREVLPFKKENRSEAEFRAVMESDALRYNARFASPLLHTEVRGIAKSISKWVWERFSTEKFSERQSARVKRRWAKVQTLAEMKPWEKDGVSRRTWERRRKAQSSGLLS